MSLPQKIQQEWQSLENLKTRKSYGTHFLTAFKLMMNLLGQSRRDFGHRTHFVPAFKPTRG